MALIGECVKNDIEVYAFCRGNSLRRQQIPVHPAIHVVSCRLEEMSGFAAEEIPQCDAFFHLGWSGTVGEARNDMPLQIKNVQYTIDAVRLAKRLGCTVFVGAGSQAEYGRTEGKLNAQTPTMPESGYGAAKLSAGHMSRIECEKLGMKHVWARILSVYGPNDNPASMLMQTIRKLLAGEKPLFTKGEQMWDYLYSEDAARALLLMADKGNENAVYCLGSGEARPLREYILALHREANVTCGLGIGELPYGEKQVMYLCADIAELQKDTGFVPETAFEEGIRRTIEWVRKEDNTDG